MLRPARLVVMLLGTVAVALLSSPPISAQRAPAAIRWSSELPAVGSGSVRIVFLTSADAGANQALEARVFTDPRVQALAEAMTCVRLSGVGKDGATLARRLNVATLPAVTFLSPGGDALGWLDGPLTPAACELGMVHALIRAHDLAQAEKAGAAPDAPANQKRAPIVWRVLLLIVPSTRVTIMEGGNSRVVDESMTAQDEQFARRSFERFPGLVASLTQGRVSVLPTVVVAPSPITAVSPAGASGFFPTARDVEPIVAPYDSSGGYDSICVYWKGSALQRAWGLGGMFTAKRSTYFVVTDSSPRNWQADNRGEVFLHEWTHGVAAWLRTLGYAAGIPSADADGGDLYGYTKSPADGWCSYYWPLYNGLVPVEGVLKGFSAEMWDCGAPRHSTAAAAQFPGPVLARFAYAEGSFDRKAKQGRYYWIETNTRGGDTYIFQEVRRDADWIVLRDVVRAIMVRLPVMGGRSEFSTDGEKTWRPLYSVSEKSIAAP